MTCRALSRSLVLWRTRPACDFIGNENARNASEPRATDERRWFLASLCGLLFAGLPSLLPAQEVAGVDLKERQEVLTTKDFPAISLAITYWPSKLKQDGSVVVLVHGEKGNQRDWGTLPKKLQDEGYAVVAVDLRGHGQSKTENGATEAVETTSKKVFPMLLDSKN